MANSREGVRVEVGIGELRIFFEGGGIISFSSVDFGTSLADRFDSDGGGTEVFISERLRFEDRIDVVS